MTISANKPPEPGECSFDKLKGTIEDEFEISCDGFEDPEFPEDDLLYEYGYLNWRGNKINLKEGDNLKEVKLNFPKGDK